MHAMSTTSPPPRKYAGGAEKKKKKKYLDGGLDGLERVSALHHVPLDLPRELDLVGDVQVDREVEQVAHALVDEGVEALDDDDGGGLDLLGGVQGAVDVVVDGLHHALPVLEVVELLEHEVELLLVGVQGGPARHLVLFFFW